MKCKALDLHVQTQCDELRVYLAAMARRLTVQAAERDWPLDDVAAMFGDCVGRELVRGYLAGRGWDGKFFFALAANRYCLHRLIVDLPLFEDRRRIRIASRAYRDGAILLLDELNQAFAQPSGHA